MLPLVSVVIRTYNEEKYLDELLSAIHAQSLDGFSVEIVLIDSGSTDNTVEISRQHGARVTYINKSDFTFGRSLNMGCAFSTGDYLVFVSGHCVPVDNNWLKNLIQPLLKKEVDYSYGRQIGRDTSKFSEEQVFRKYFPENNQCPQSGFFVNNANSALTRDAWQRFQFDEQLTGLEDMELGKRLVAAGGKIGYLANAVVYHIHDESWKKVKIRYEREAIALQHIMPEVHLGLGDVLRYWISAILNDFSVATREGQFWHRLAGVLAFRTMQYWGSYKGNHEHRKMSARRKEAYFYPR